MRENVPKINPAKEALKTPEGSEKSAVKGEAPSTAQCLPAASIEQDKDEKATVPAIQYLSRVRDSCENLIFRDSVTPSRTRKRLFILRLAALGIIILVPLSIAIFYLIKSTIAPKETTTTKDSISIVDTDEEGLE